MHLEFISGTIQEALDRNNLTGSLLAQLLIIFKYLYILLTTRKLLFSISHGPDTFLPIYEVIQESWYGLITKEAMNGNQVSGQLVKGYNFLSLVLITQQML